MSFLNKLDERFPKNSSKSVNLTLRLSEAEVEVLDDIVMFREITKQDLITALIQEELIKPYKATLIDESPSKYYLLNTNKANDKADHDDMINNGIAAAFEDGYKEKINRIKSGDYVFLYESGVGIVAYGQATGDVKVKSHYEIPDKTFYQELKKFKKLSRPISAGSIIKDVLKRKIPFASTLISVVDGNLIFDYIKEKNL